jgi:hypothetical protein
MTGGARLGALAVSLTLALAACPRTGPIARPYPPPAADELLGALGARQQAVTALNAAARATSWLGGERVRATVLMLVERAGRLRLEAEVSLQGTVAVLATDRQRFALFDARKNELRRGPACPANVASLIRIPLGPEDIAAILLGDVRLPPGTAGDGATVSWDSTRGTDVLEVPRAGGYLRLHFQPPRAGGERRLSGVVATDADRRPRWRVAFEDHDAVTVPGAAAPVSMPGIIRFAEGAGSFDDGVEIKLKDRRVGEAAAPDAFTLSPPAGARVVEIGCGPVGSS